MVNRILISGLVLTLTCWSAQTIAAEPAAFTFIERSNVATNVFITSETKTVSGASGDSWTVSVSGGNSPQYRIGSGAFTSAPGSISTGQTLTVRHLSASTANTAVITTVTVGSFSPPFKSVTGALDRTPDPFSFGAKGFVAPSTVIESATIAPTGFNTGVPIIAGPNVQYRIGTGAYTSASGTLQPQQTLTVQHTASAKRLEYTKTYLKIGGVIGYFTTRTQGQVEGSAYPLTPPTLSIADASAAESAGTMNFTVSLSRSHDQAVTVDYATADNGALTGKDYTARSGTLNFAIGQIRKTISVPLVGDDCSELVEGYTVTLSNPNAATLQTASATGTIQDDDPAGAPFKVGAAKRVVSPRAADIAGWPHEYCAAKTQFSYLGGFGLRDLGADPCDSPALLPGKAVVDGINRDWHVRVMIVEQSPTNRMAFVTLDAIGAGNIIYEGVKRAVNAQTGIPKDNVVFGQTHSHAGADLQGIWGGMPFEWRQYLYQQAGAAAKDAFDNRADVDLAYAQGIIDMPSFNNYRRNDGTIGTDKRLTAIQARRQSDDAVVGTLVQYPAHPTNVGSSNRKTHPDYIEGLTQRLEEVYGGTAVFYNGPIADASPNSSAAGSTAGLDQYQRAEFMGRGLAERVISLMNAGMKKFMPLLNVQHRTANIPITNHLFAVIAGKGWFNGYYDFANPAPDPGARATAAPQAVSVAVTLVSRVTLGKIGCECLEVVTIPGEASNLVGTFVRSLAPRDMALLGLTQNSFGYILDEAQYSSENGATLATDPDPVYPAGYEEGVSMGPGTAGALREQAYNPLFGFPPGTGAPAP